MQIYLINNQLNSYQNVIQTQICLFNPKNYISLKARKNELE